MYLENVYLVSLCKSILKHQTKYMYVYYLYLPHVVKDRLHLLQRLPLCLWQDEDEEHQPNGSDAGVHVERALNLLTSQSIGTGVTFTFLTSLVMASMRLRKVIDTRRLNAQLKEVAMEFPALRAHNG